MASPQPILVRGLSVRTLGVQCTARGLHGDESLNTFFVSGSELSRFLTLHRLILATTWEGRFYCCSY